MLKIEFCVGLSESELDKRNLYVLHLENKSHDKDQSANI